MQVGVGNVYAGTRREMNTLLKHNDGWRKGEQVLLCNFSNTLMGTLYLGNSVLDSFKSKNLIGQIFATRTWFLSYVREYKNLQDLLKLEITQ